MNNKSIPEHAVRLSTTDKEMSSTEKAVLQLSEIVSDLTMAVEMLVKRLSPVIIDDPDKAPSGIAHRPISTGDCQMARQILVQVTRLQDEVGNIRNLACLIDL